jgi:putative addiction module killer protein
MASGIRATPRESPVLVEEYVDESGYSAWQAFFESLPSQAAAKAAVAIEKLEQGHTGCLKALGTGLAEWKIDWGPGIRIYLHQDGKKLVLLMGGSYGKAGQSAEIAAARRLLAAFKRRKKLN